MPKKKANEGARDLETYVENLNAQATHIADPVFYLHRDTETGVLLSIEVRFSPASYRWYNLAETWESLTYNAQTRSHKTLFVATTPEMLSGGILELKVASRNHNFREDFIAKTLEWLSGYFFPKAAKHRNSENLD